MKDNLETSEKKILFINISTTDNDYAYFSVIWEYLYFFFISSTFSMVIEVYALLLLEKL